MTVLENFKKGVGRFAERGMAVYDRLMARSLGVDRLHTYYSGSGGFLRDMNKAYWHLPEERLAQFLTKPPAQILGKEVIEKFLRRRVRLHAFRAAVVTFLCALPTGWLMWPLMVVDIVYFQREVFLFSQEVYMMYQPRRTCRRFKFDYVNVTMLVAKLLEPIAVRQVKTGLGLAGRTAVKRGVKMFRVPIQVFLRQVFKWCGVSVTKEIVEKCIDLLVIGFCAVIAGLVSYWLFVPMARHMARVARTNA